MAQNDNAHSIRLVNSLEKNVGSDIAKGFEKNIHYQKVQILKRNMNGQKISVVILNRTLTRKQLLKLEKSVTVMMEKLRCSKVLNQVRIGV